MWGRICSFNNYFYFQDVPADLDIKAKVEGILSGAEADQKRARVMDIDDFMKLLYAFNAEGIHFS